MIKVTTSNEGLSKEIFELIRMKFPTAEFKYDLYVYLDLDNGKFEIKSDNFYEEFFVNLSDKYSIKKDIYYGLKHKFEINDKWGILTGVRPTKLGLTLFKNNSIENFREILKNKYLLHKDSVNLIEEIVNKEYEIIYPLRDTYSIYIHIPFCPTKCSYCSFQTMIANKSIEDAYVDRLIEEIKNEKKYLNKELKSIYIGGGTPSALSEENLYKLISFIDKNFNSRDEFTVECGRVDTITKDKLKILKSFGVNRVSVNPQTFNENTLSLINRRTNLGNFFEIYELVDSFNFNSINMDLILGLSGETLDDVKKSLAEAVKLNPKNITVHTLALKNGSNMFIENKKHSSTINDMIFFSKNYLKSKGYSPYYMYRQKRMAGNGENIGYGKNDFCYYNIMMMEEKETIIGFGLGSSSKFFNRDTERVDLVMNTKNLKDYLNGNINRKLKYYEV